MQHISSRRFLAVAGLLGCTWLAQGCCGPKEQVTSLRPVERQALAAAALQPEALELRAGDEIERTPLATSERAELTRAAGDAAELEALRAGDLNLDDRELKIIGITAAVVVLIIIIA